MSRPRLRVVFTTASRSASGMAAAAVCAENVEPVGFLLDTGPVKLTKRSQRPPVPRSRQLWMFARLAARFPEHFLPALYGKLGFSPTDSYEAQRAAERRVAACVLSACGDGFRELLTPELTRFPTLAEVAARYRAPFVEVGNVNSDESASLLKSWRPDVIVSLGDRIIKPHILELPRVGVLNCHSSLLPGYRGTSTEFWQLVNGERETGVTVHWMAQRVDEGAILVQGKWPVPPGANHWQLRAASQFLRLPAWRQAIRRVIDGDPGRPQEPSDQPTFGLPHIEDLYAFYILHKTPPGLPSRSPRCAAPSTRR